MLCKPLTRRSLLLGSFGLVSSAAPNEPAAPMYVYETKDYLVRITVEDWDEYQNGSLGFREGIADQPFCLSATGQENQDCLKGFRGSLAVAHYLLEWRKASVLNPFLKELVRDIDRSDSVPVRAPYERSIPLRDGTASDIQAFGYTVTPGCGNALRVNSARRAWWLARQDLYLGAASVPFLIGHWKHRLDGIRLLDIIPGPGTRHVQGDSSRPSK
jgi:hypothetical protein